jgi:RNA polymerase sigma-70 factor (ECF subfamily)
VNHGADLGVARRAAAGDLAAFAVLVREHQSALRRFARRLAGDDGDDLAQEALLKAWKAIGQYRGDAAFSTWLQRILLRLFLDRKRAAPEPLMPEVEPRQHPDRRIAIDRALGGLALRERAAAVLVFAEGHSHTEAAEAMGVPLGTLKSLVARARTRLLPLLEGVE